MTHIHTSHVLNVAIESNNFKVASGSFLEFFLVSRQTRDLFFC